MRSATSSRVSPWNSSSISLGAKISETAATAPARMRAEDGRPAYEGTAADAERAAVGEGPAHFLFERLEESRRDDEHDRPQAVERCVFAVGELARGEDLEPVRGDPRDDEPGTDGIGAFRQRAVSRRVHQPLRSMCHVPSPVRPAQVLSPDHTAARRQIREADATGTGWAKALGEGVGGRCWAKVLEEQGRSRR